MYITPPPTPSTKPRSLLTPCPIPKYTPPPPPLRGVFVARCLAELNKQNKPQGGAWERSLAKHMFLQTHSPPNVHVSDLISPENPQQVSNHDLGQSLNGAGGSYLPTTSRWASRSRKNWDSLDPRAEFLWVYAKAIADHSRLHQTRALGDTGCVLRCSFLRCWQCCTASGGGP